MKDFKSLNKHAQKLPKAKSVVLKTQQSSGIMSMFESKPDEKYTEFIKKKPDPYKESMFIEPFIVLNREEVRNRVLLLWRLAYHRARGARAVLHGAFSQQRCIYAGGLKYKKNLLTNIDENSDLIIDEQT